MRARPALALVITGALLVGGVAPPVAAQAESPLAPLAEEAERAGQAAGGQLDCSFPFATADATGTEVTVEREPETIVTLNPSAAQTVWEIGGREKVVGLTRYAGYLEGADSRMDVAADSGNAFVNVEAVIELQPELVLAPNTIPNETVEQLRDAGLTVYKFDFARSIDAVEEKTHLTGRLVGECEGAEETVAWMRSELDRVDRAVEGRERPRVLYVFGGYTAGTGTFVHRVVERAGGRNVAAEANLTGYAQINEEVVADRDPEWIVVNDNTPEVPQTAAYEGTTAVQRDQVVVLREPYVSQPAPRIVRSVATLAEALHPEAYEAAGRATEAATETQGGTTATTEATASNGQPGLGAVAALLGLLAAALLARRW